MANAHAGALKKRVLRELPAKCEICQNDYGPGDYSPNLLLCCQSFVCSLCLFKWPLCPYCRNEKVEKVGLLE